MRQLKRIALAGAAALFAGGSLEAGDAKLVIDDKAPVAESAWSICDLWDLSTLYENDQGFLNGISLIGRYQGQYHATEGNQGDDSDWENRRFRFGSEIEFLQNFTAHGEVNLKTDYDSAGRFVDSVEELWISWEPNDDLYLIVGKQKPKIGQERATSSKRILTFERSLIIDQTVPEKIGGVVLGYHLTEQLWAEGGIYSGAVTDDWLLPEFNGDIAASARIGYGITEETEARFDYFYAAGADTDNGVEEYDHVFSWNTTSQWGQFGLATDIIYAAGIDDAHNSDVFGIVFMPSYYLTDDLQAVFRYQYAVSDSDDGIRLRSRYERAGDAAPLNTRGEDYHAFYAGLNYYICDHKLKLMLGAEYATLDSPNAADWDGWTWLAGVRMYY